MVGASKTPVVEQSRWRKGAEPRPLGGQEKVCGCSGGCVWQEVREEARKGGRDSMAPWQPGVRARLCLTLIAQWEALLKVRSRGRAGKGYLLARVFCDLPRSSPTLPLPTHLAHNRLISMDRQLPCFMD